MTSAVPFDISRWTLEIMTSWDSTGTPITSIRVSHSRVATGHNFLCQSGHSIMNCVDDFFAVGILCDACDAYDALYAVLLKLGFTLSLKKLVPPGTKAVCLGIAFDTEKGKISIPAEK